MRTCARRRCLFVQAMISYPGARPAAVSSADGVHCPIMTSWQEGLGACGVIQNHKAVWKDVVGSVATYL